MNENLNAYIYLKSECIKLRDENKILKETIIKLNDIIEKLNKKIFDLLSKCDDLDL